MPVAKYNRLYRPCSLVIILLLLCTCFWHKSPSPADPEFDFIFKYGDFGRNVLNTFDQTYTKSTRTLEGLYVARFTLSKKEMHTILDRMLEIDIFSYPDTIPQTPPPPPPPPPKPGQPNIPQLIPFSHPSIPHPCYLSIEYARKSKEIYWADPRDVFGDRAVNLKKLLTDIERMIHAKEAYKKMPPGPAYL